MNLFVWAIYLIGVGLTAEMTIRYVAEKYASEHWAKRYLVIATVPLLWPFLLVSGLVSSLVERVKR